MLSFFDEIQIIIINKLEKRRKRKEKHNQIQSKVNCSWKMLELSQKTASAQKFLAGVPESGGFK